MLRLLGRCLLVMSAMALPGCVSGSADADGLGGDKIDAGGSGGAAVAGGAGQATGGVMSGGAGGASSFGGSATSPPMACTSYMDATGYKLSVHITNKMSRTLYLGQDEMSCPLQRLFQVADGARAVLPSLEGCHTSCEAMMSSGPVQCPLNCTTPATVTLEAGQSLEIPWDGRFAVPQTLPTACLQNVVTAPASCIQAQKVEASLFTFTARAGSTRQCLDPSGTCNCIANAGGGCTSAASLISGTIYTTEFIVKLEPGETSPGGEPQFIGLEFKD